ncbi:MAG: CHRD domain-containing protein [Tepidiformaceae bacterium]
MPVPSSTAASVPPLADVPTPPPGPLQPTDLLITALDMSGDNEVPPVTTTTIGSFGATLSADTLCYTLGAQSAGVLTGARIYHGEAGEIGDPVVQLLMTLDGTDSFVTSGCISAVNIGGSLAGNWAAFLQALNSGDLYVNIQSMAHPEGEIRGQIFVSPGQSEHPGTAATPAVPGVGSGGIGPTNSDSWLLAGGRFATIATAMMGGWAAMQRHDSC